jgi:signal transduction histidine kinase
MDSQQRNASVEHLRSKMLAEQAASLASLEAEWHAKTEETQRALEASQQQVAQLQSEAQQLRDEAMKAADWRTKYEALAGEIAGHHQRAVELQSELDRARADLQTLQAARDQFDVRTNEVSVYHQREAALQAELEQLRQDLHAARESRPSAEPQAQEAGPSPREAELQAELERARAELQRLAAQTAELDQLRAAAQASSEWQMKYMALAIEAGSQQQRKLELQAELERAQADLQTLGKQATELQQLRAELQTALEWRARYDAAVDEGMAHQQRATELREELERLRREMDAASVQMQAAAQRTAEVARLQTELQSKTQEIERLTAEAEVLRAGPLAGDRPRTDELRARLEGELQTLRLQLEIHQRQAAAWRIDYEAMLEQERQLRTELDLTRAELRRLGEAPAPPPAPPVETVDPQRLQQLQAQLEKAQAELAAQTTAASEAREELAARERQFAKLQNVVATLNDQARRLTDMQTELADTKARLHATQASLGERNTEFFEAQRQLAAKDRELTDAMAALAELSTQTQTLTHTQKQLAEAQAALSTAQAGRAEADATLTEGSARPFLPEASVEVIASLSQELRQPMSAIVGYSDLLLSESVGILGALQRKFLERIKASCERMESLLHDLIRVTDIDSGSLKLVQESLDVMYIVEDAILSCGAQFREKGINLRLDVAEKLPTVSADRDALRQILTHLLNNAGNASDANGEVVLTVREDAGQSPNGADDRRLFISVRDSGGGIAPADQPRVFSRFYRADAPLIAGLGDTGVGLSVAKALVEAHGGRLWFTTEQGKGSTFNVILPVRGQSGPNGMLSN